MSAASPSELASRLRPGVALYVVATLAVATSAIACGGGYVAPAPARGTLVAMPPACDRKLYLEVSNPTQRRVELRVYTTRGMIGSLDPLMPGQTRRYEIAPDAGVRSVLGITNDDEIVPAGRTGRGPIEVEVSPRWVCDS